MNHNSWWFEPPSKRLALWRDFRQSLDTDNITELCNTVIEWWQHAPLVNITIDPVDSTNWPTPWEMLHQGDFCENSLSLGMAYTIYYANPKIKNELLFVTNEKKSFQQLCAKIDDNYLLNYERGMISNFTEIDDISVSYSVNINKIVQ